ncbi:SPRY domain containing protein [Trichomonas vaginalis G3]|uniref:SPRY domain containing protein n=1 Tax=Trichomonas vaginalis (strain ATCC PRA-98 / G3) TaxID=412133 RepID=A2EBF7_TRIV3|nr:euchromatin binding [Trichomonas vaginalis G3]EAY09987.1 SPRY domain containing protein [Trichomonas vaginalis G3]KAI5535067.1 euchromatin binding [Trichomonas vaginalis G3]|eukprot:XP_001322210.1 SPRY domain containing protein [Trichomonas vaginalis G3]
MSQRKTFIITDPNDPFYGSSIPMRFEELGARRRAALRLLPNIEDPENKSKIVLSRYKSSRKYKFDGDKCTLEGGYRLCRSSRSFDQPGKYFWEFRFTSRDLEDGHVRMGIATTNADMEAPIGVDAEGYAVRDLGGAFHCSKHQKPEEYDPGVVPFQGFNVGDFVGFGFTLGTTPETTTLEVWVNGMYRGVIFRNIDPTKKWIPSLSIFHNAWVEAFFEVFNYAPGPAWTPAANIPDEPQKQKYTLSQMLDVMRNGTESLRTKEMFAATFAVLTPIQDMPI